MNAFDPTITKRVRRRKLKGGRVVEQARWFVNYRDPDTGKRKLPSFELRRDAEAFRAHLMAEVHSGTYVDPARAPTVKEAVEHYLRNRKGEVKNNTHYQYCVIAKLITGPVLEGTPKQRAEFVLTGKLPSRDARVLQMLGQVKTNELTTADIRT